MKVDREKLENELLVAFENYGANNEIVSRLQSKLHNKGFDYGKTRGIINTNIPLETLDNEKLFLITNALYQVTQDKKLDINNYFNESEIKEMENFKIEKTIKQDYLEISNVIKISDKEWTTKASLLNVNKWYNDNLLRYNQKTQRNTIAKEYRNKIIERIDINKTSVREIADLLVKRKYKSSTLTFNILHDGNEKFEFIEEEQKLKIHHHMEILDGFHRSLAILSALNTDSTLECFNMTISIRNYTIEEAQEFIEQEDKRNKISQRYLKSLKQDNLGNKVTRQLNELPNSELRGKITTNLNLYKFNSAYVLFDILSDSILNEFEIKSIRDVNNITDYLIEGFNEIIGIFVDDFRDLESSRKNNYKTYSNMFIGYISLLKEFYGKDNWKIKLEKTLNNINFDINNPIWNEDNLNIKNTQIGTRGIKKISQYFKNLIEKEVGK